MTMESEDEDLNKCRDLVASDDGCDLARRGKQPWRAKRAKQRAIQERVKRNEKTTPMMRIKSTQEICIHAHGRSIKEKQGKKIGTVSPEIARNCQRRRTSAEREIPSRLVSSGGGTLRCRRMNAIFHGCYEDGSLPETGSGIGESA